MVVNRAQREDELTIAEAREAAKQGGLTSAEAKPQPCSPSRIITVEQITDGNLNTTYRVNIGLSIDLSQREALILIERLSQKLQP